MCDDLDVINFLLLLHHHLCVWPPCGGFTPLFFSCYCLYSTVSLAAFFFLLSLPLSFHYSIYHKTLQKLKKKKRCLFPPLLCVCVCNLSSRLKKNSKKKKRQQQHNHHRVAYLIIVLLTPSRHDLLLFLSSLKLKKVDFLFLSFLFVKLHSKNKQKIPLFLISLSKKKCLKDFFLFVYFWIGFFAFRKFVFLPILYSSIKEGKIIIKQKKNSSFLNCYKKSPFFQPPSVDPLPFLRVCELLWAQFKKKR